MKKKSILSLFKKNNTEPHFKEQSNRRDIELKEKKISENLDENLATFKALYSVPTNIDVKIREFSIGALHRRAFIIYLSTMTKVDYIQKGIVEDLIENTDVNKNIQEIVTHPILNTVDIIEDILVRY